MANDEACWKMNSSAPVPSGSQGPPDSDLPLPLGGPDQEEAGDVRASDEEHEPDGAHEEEEPRARSGDGQVLLAEEADTVLDLFRMQLSDPGRDAIHLTLGLFQGDARCEPGQDLHVPGIPDG